MRHLVYGGVPVCIISCSHIPIHIRNGQRLLKDGIIRSADRRVCEQLWTCQTGPEEKRLEQTPNGFWHSDMSQVLPLWIGTKDGPMRTLPPKPNRAPADQPVFL
ncbi:hypothetical protein Q5P01_004614 [Channa striata]|uniref:Uncharacterized protein n=1 Tax=Channa striata TaxID=64152 RepID=A0AA88SYN1_CHASR|nr:hypothetical protein Q5P01_004614 [Channa striata]